MENTRDTINRRLLQFSLLALAFFVPFSIAGASTAIGLGTVAWIWYALVRRDRLYDRIGREGDVDARHDPFLFVSLLLLLSAIPSVIMSDNFDRATTDWRSYWLLLTHFLVAVHIVRVRVRTQAYWLVFVAATIACLVGFIQRAGGVDLGWFEIGGERRVSGTMFTMTFAGILYQLVVFNVAVALGAKLATRTRIIILAGASIQFITLLLTLTRGAWLAVIAGLITVCLLIRNRAVAISAAVLIVGLATFTFIYGNDNERALSLTRMMNTRVDSNISTRLVLWDIAWEMFKAEPVTGVGMGDFESKATAMLDGRHVETAVDAHNVYLHVMATRGLIGFVPFLLFWIVLLRELFRGRRRQERGSLEWGYMVGAIGVTVAVMVGALTELNIDDEEVFIAFMFLTGFARSAMYTPTRPTRASDTA